MILRPTRSTRTATLFPYTTRFRSTYKIRAASGNYVLRRKPYGPRLPSAHAVDREYKVQSGLHKMGFPVARQYGLCTDDDVVGSWFYVMGMVDGHTIWDGAMPESTPANRTSEEHTSELQALMRPSYAVFCLKQKKPTHTSRTPLILQRNSLSTTTISRSP